MNYEIVFRACTKYCFLPFSGLQALLQKVDRSCSPKVTVSFNRRELTPRWCPRGLRGLTRTCSACRCPLLPFHKRRPLEGRCAVEPPLRREIARFAQRQVKQPQASRQEGLLGRRGQRQRHRLTCPSVRVPSTYCRMPRHRGPVSVGNRCVPVRVSRCCRWPSSHRGWLWEGATPTCLSPLRPNDEKNLPIGHCFNWSWKGTLSLHLSFFPKKLSSVFFSDSLCQF